MSLTLDVRQEAANDIRESVRYLARESESVAAEFKDDVGECLTRLAEYPGIGTVRARIAALQ